MRKLIILLVLAMSGCAFHERVEYDVIYSVTSSVPCIITYLDEHSTPVTVSDVTDFEKRITMTAYVDSGFGCPRVSIIKEKYCLGTIGITVDGKGASKTISISCCCEESLKYEYVVTGTRGI